MRFNGCYDSCIDNMVHIVQMDNLVHKDNTSWNISMTKVICWWSLIKKGLYQKKSKVSSRIWNFQRCFEERACGNSGGQLKKKWNFQGCSRKTRVEFLWILVFGVGISKVCHTVLQSFQGWELVFAGISKGKV